MGITPTTTSAADGDSESATLLIPKSTDHDKIPKDSFHLAYIIYFTLGAGYLLPWNAFITAVDYFTYLYPGVSVDRVFAIVYMLVGLASLFLIVAFAHRSNSHVRINVGYVLFLVALLAVPLMDVWYVDGRVGVYGGYYATVGVVALCGIADGLVQGGVVGNAGELPERYMQAVLAGTAASGVLVSILRVLTKAMFPQDTRGLRQSANLYFIVSIAVMLLNIIFYNIAHRLPVVKYHNDLKKNSVAANDERHNGHKGGNNLTLWDVVGAVKWYASGIVITYIVTLSIFPGSVTEDVHSDTLDDWYPIILIAGYNIFDLVGKSLTALCLVGNAKAVVGFSYLRLLFLPVFYVCLNGPRIFRTEVPVTVLVCLLGLTNGYFTSALMILAPKIVPIQHAETAAVVLVLSLVFGLALGSVVSWFWVL